MVFSSSGVFVLAVLCRLNIVRLFVIAIGLAAVFSHGSSVQVCVDLIVNSLQQQVCESSSVSVLTVQLYKYFKLKVVWEVAIGQAAIPIGQAVIPIGQAEAAAVGQAAVPIGQTAVVARGQAAYQ